MFLTHGLAEAAGRDRLLVYFLGSTGVRYREMAALLVRNLDLLKRRALIAEAVADVNGPDTPKNHQRRSVPIPRFLVAELAEHVAGRGPDDFVFAAERPRCPRDRTCSPINLIKSPMRWTPRGALFKIMRTFAD